MKQWIIDNERQQQWATNSTLALVATNGSFCQRRFEQRFTLHP